MQGASARPPTLWESWRHSSATRRVPQQRRCGPSHEFVACYTFARCRNQLTCLTRDAYRTSCPSLRACDFPRLVPSHSSPSSPTLRSSRPDRRRGNRHMRKAGMLPVNPAPPPGRACRPGSTCLADRRAMWLRGKRKGKRRLQQHLESLGHSSHVLVGKSEV
jgi:hypothetical protein